MYAASSLLCSYADSLTWQSDAFGKSFAHRSGCHFQRLPPAGYFVNRVQTLRILSRSAHRLLFCSEKDSESRSCGCRIEHENEAYMKSLM